MCTPSSTIIETQAPITTNPPHRPANQNHGRASEHIVEASPSCIGILSDTMLTCNVRHPLVMDNDQQNTREEQGTWHCCYKYQPRPRQNTWGRLDQHQPFLESFHVILLEPVAKADNSRTNSSSHWGESLQDQRAVPQAFCTITVIIWERGNTSVSSLDNEPSLQIACFFLHNRQVIPAWNKSHSFCCR
jgi:hypothetical protein